MVDHVGDGARLHALVGGGVEAVVHADADETDGALRAVGRREDPALADERAGAEVLAATRLQRHEEVELAGIIDGFAADDAAGVQIAREHRPLRDVHHRLHRVSGHERARLVGRAKQLTTGGDPAGGGDGDGGGSEGEPTGASPGGEPTAARPTAARATAARRRRRGDGDGDGEGDGEGEGDGDGDGDGNGVMGRGPQSPQSVPIGQR